MVLRECVLCLANFLFSLKGVEIFMRMTTFEILSMVNPFCFCFFWILRNRPLCFHKCLVDHNIDVMAWQWIFMGWYFVVFLCFNILIWYLQGEPWGLPSSFNGKWFGDWRSSCTRYESSILILAYPWGCLLLAC